MLVLKTDSSSFYLKVEDERYKYFSKLSDQVFSIAITSNKLANDCCFYYYDPAQDCWTNSWGSSAMDLSLVIQTFIG